MNTFIQFDKETKRVAAVLMSDAEKEPGFVKISKNIPESEPGKDALFYNDESNECYFDVETTTEDHRMQSLEAENQELKDRLQMVEDALLYMTIG